MGYDLSFKKILKMLNGRCHMIRGFKFYFFIFFNQILITPS